MEVHVSVDVRVGREVLVTEDTPVDGPAIRQQHWLTNLLTVNWGINHMKSGIETSYSATGSGGGGVWKVHVKSVRERESTKPIVRALSTAGDLTLHPDHQNQPYFLHYQIF